MKVEEKYEEVKKMLEEAESYQKLRSLDKNGEAKEMLKGKDAEYVRQIKDIKKMRKIKSFLPKAANVLEVKSQLVSRINIIKEQIIEMDNLEKEIEKEEKAFNDQRKQWSDLDKKIAKAKEPEERAKLIEKQEKFKESFLKDGDVDERQQRIEEKRNILNKKMTGKSKEELAKESFELGKKVSMCNVAVRGLLEGKEIGDIDLDKNIKGKKFDSNDEIKRILKFSREKNKEEKDKKQKIEQGEEIDITDLEEKIINQSEELLKEQETGGALVEVYDFTEKHPNLARIPGLARIVNAIKNRKVNTEVEKAEVKVKNKEVKQEKEEKQEDSKKVYIPREENEFKKFLKESAEKGMKEASVNVIKNSDKLKQMKEDAMLRQDAKFLGGKEKTYSQRSGDAER